MLYNDDVHSFEAVIMQLLEANPLIEKTQAENFALRVDSQVDGESRREKERRGRWSGER